MDQSDWTNLMATLSFLAGPAGLVAWNVYWSNLLRVLREGDAAELSAIGKRLAAWVQARSPEVLQLLHGFGSLIVPVAAKIILDSVSPETIEAIQPYYAFATMLLLSYIGSQAWYVVSKAKSQPSATVTTEVSPSGGVTTTSEVNGSAPIEVEQAQG